MRATGNLRLRSPQRPRTGSNIVGGATLVVRGEPTAFLAGLKVPSGIDTVVVTTKKGPLRVLAAKGAYKAAGSIDERKPTHVPQEAERRSAVIDPTAFEPGPRAQAIIRGLRLAEADLRAAGGTYELGEVQGLLRGISRQAIEKRVREGSLLAVPGPSNRRRYPVAQFKDEGGVVNGLAEVQAALPSRDPWFVLNFLVQPDPLFEGSRPIDLLKRNEWELVVESASRVGIQGA